MFGCCCYVFYRMLYSCQIPIELEMRTSSSSATTRDDVAEEINRYWMAHQAIAKIQNGDAADKQIDCRLNGSFQRRQSIINIIHI